MSYDFIIRILAAAIIGGVIGIEREYRAKEAGFRTHFLVALGSALFMVVSQFGFEQTGGTVGNISIDPSRIASQVVTGIGFIGGGTVLRHGANVFGLTTAATLWMAASIGMACGAGMYGIAICATIISIIVLVSVRFFEKSVLVSSTKSNKRLRLNICCENENAENIYNYIVDKFPRLREISKKPSKQNDNLTKISVVAEVFWREPIQGLYKSFQNLEGIDSIAIQECMD